MVRTNGKRTLEGRSLKEPAHSGFPLAKDAEKGGER